MSGVLAVLAAVVGATGSAAAQPWPTRVDATYRVTFGVLGEIGTFKFQSNLTGQGYALTGDAKLSAPLNAFDWAGTTNSAGKMQDDGPRPAAYTFNFKSSVIFGSSRQGSVRMAFGDGGVTNVNVVPPGKTPGDLVPVLDQHLKDVLDPLSAVMALSRSRSATANPCGRKLPIFDGKQRFDLVLSSIRQQRVTESRPSGQPGIGYVCRVRYIPISGHRDNAEARQIAENKGIEISLRPVPSANLVVPYHVSIPTAGGTAIVTLVRIDITTSGNKQIALTHSS